jgi:hypothetical protein
MRTMFLIYMVTIALGTFYAQRTLRQKRVEAGARAASPHGRCVPARAPRANRLFKSIDSDALVP